MKKIREYLMMLLCINIVIASINEWAIWSKIATGINALALLGCIGIDAFKR